MDKATYLNNAVSQEAKTILWQFLCFLSSVHRWPGAMDNNIKKIIDLITWQIYPVYKSTYILSFNPLSCQGAGSNCRSTTECFKFSINNHTIVILKTTKNVGLHLLYNIIPTKQHVFLVHQITRPDPMPWCTCSFITSPHAGAPTRPVPTLESSLSNEPTLRGFS